MLSKIVLIFLIPVPVFAFLDSIGDHARSAANAAAYADAASELLLETTGTSRTQQTIKALEVKLNQVSSKLGEVQDLGYDISRLSDYPEWDNGDILNSMRDTTQYIRRVKRTVARAVALGTEGLAAYNSLESMVTLNKILDNDIKVEADQRRRNLIEIEKDIEQEKKWQNLRSYMIASSHSFYRLHKVGEAR